MRNRFNWRGITKFCLLVMLIPGCGTISSNTVQLSVELTNRIKDIEASHRAFVNTYFDSKVEQINTFLDEKWTPLFLRNFLGTSQILNDLSKPVAISENTRLQLTEAAKLYLDDPSEAGKMSEEIVKKLNKKRSEDKSIVDTVVKKYVPSNRMSAASMHLMSVLQLDTPARLIMDFAEAANEQIRARRDSLIKPIEQARKKALEEITVAYQDFYAGQGVVTARLEAAADRGTQQAQLVDSVAGEGTAARINKSLNEFAVDFNGAFEKVDDMYKKYKIDKSAKDGGASQIVDTLQQEIDKALQKYNLK